MKKQRKGLLEQSNNEKRGNQPSNHKRPKETRSIDKTISYTPHDFDYNADHEAFRSIN